jgi:hypothetical protein
MLHSRTGWLLLALVLGVYEVSAQQARSFEQLQMLVRQEDRITIIEPNGQTTTGSIVQLTDSSLRIIAGGSPREFLEQNVLQIRARRADSLNDGAKYGGVVGGVLGVVAAVTWVLADSGGCVGCAVASLPIYTALGIGTGVAIDAMLTRESTIFSADRAASAFILRPELSASRAGFSLRFSF